MNVKRVSRSRPPVLAIPIFFLVTFCCAAVSSLLLIKLLSTQRSGPELLDVTRQADGTLSGSYRLTSTFFNRQEVSFSVTPQGSAVFDLDGKSLLVEMPDAAQASLDWQGTRLDGYGDLSEAESHALADLWDQETAQALALIALDLGCQPAEQVDPLQLAALVFPWQMRFKYQLTDRAGEAARLAPLSACEYWTQIGAAPAPGLLSFSPAVPVPVVIEYFPFDAEGALEPDLASLDPDQLAAYACLPLQTDGGWLASAWPGPPDVPIPPDKEYNFDVPLVDEFGACGARCRGACGLGCTLNNCTHSQDFWCVPDQSGLNTGNIVRVDRYDCGVHEGCVRHDACYDDCNTRYLCGSWRSVVCRHANSLLNPPEITPDELLSCDSLAFKYFGRANSLSWAAGGGPFERKLVYTYVDRAYGEIWDFERCPVLLMIHVTPEILLAGQVNLPYPFKLSVAGIPETISSVRFEWNFGDEGAGSQVVAVQNGSAELELEHTFSDAGSYGAYFQLYNDTNARGDLLGEVEVDIEILASATTVSVFPTIAQGDVGAAIPFSASANPSGDYRYDWDFGDGSQAEDAGAEIAHPYAAPGDYSVSVRLYDRSGKLLAEDASTAKVTAPATATPEAVDTAEPAPVTTLTELIVIPEPTATQIETSFIVLGENFPADPSFEWDFGEPFFETNGVRGFQMWTTTPEAIWTYYEAGTFEVTVLVRDKENYPVILATLTWWVTVEGK